MHLPSYMLTLYSGKRRVSKKRLALSSRGCCDLESRRMTGRDSRIARDRRDARKGAQRRLAPYALAMLFASAKLTPLCSNGSKMTENFLSEAGLDVAHTPWPRNSSIPPYSGKGY